MMIKRYFWIILLIISLKVDAQTKPDVIVFGGSVAGASAAIQAARSGVKTLLILPDSSIISNPTLSFKIPAFNLGLWKEWHDAYQKASDSSKTTPDKVLEDLVKKTKNLSFLRTTVPLSIEEKKNGWEVKIILNNKKEDLKCKVLLDATSDYKNSPLFQNGIIDFDNNGHFQSLVNYHLTQKTTSHQQNQLLYRTSGAAGFGKDSTLAYIPLGVFIPRDKPNVLIISNAAFKSSKKEGLQNLALWTNMGQAVGALAAYGPFFNTTPAKANIRMTQGEVFTYKSFLYPVLDIAVTDSAFYPVQKIIASGLLQSDFKTGQFHPDEKVKLEDIKSILIELYPRSKIWFIEHTQETDLSLANFIALASFTTAKDPYYVHKEIAADWKDKYHFDSNFDEQYILSKKEFAILADQYLSPFNVNVDFNGRFLR